MVKCSNTVASTFRDMTQPTCSCTVGLNHAWQLWWKCWVQPCFKNQGRTRPTPGSDEGTNQGGPSSPPKDEGPPNTNGWPAARYPVSVHFNFHDTGIFSRYQSWLSLPHSSHSSSVMCTRLCMSSNNADISVIRGFFRWQRHYTCKWKKVGWKSIMARCAAVWKFRITYFI